MSNRLSLGYSQAVAASQVERDWKDKLRLVVLFIGLLAALASLMAYFSFQLEPLPLDLNAPALHCPVLK
jgi:hypothetical protein